MIVTRAIRIIMLALVCAGVGAGSALAESHGSAPHVDLRLIAERPSIAPGETLTLALQQTIEPGWHTYWRNPGDAGEATHVSWTLPAGVTASEIEWPAPKRIDIGPLTNFGYEKEAVLLIDIKVPATLAPGTNLPIGAEVTWQVCKDICVPEEMHLDLNVPIKDSGVAPDPLWTNVFAAARKAVPRPLPQGAAFAVDGAHLTLVLNDANLAAAIRNLTLYPVDTGIIKNSGAQSWTAGQKGPFLALQPSAKLTAPGTKANRFAAVLVAEDRAGEPTVFSVTAERNDALAGLKPVSGVAAFALALLGGLLLNLMPCVFPVLSMKVVALAQMGGADARSARLESVAYGLGVILGFLAVGGTLIALRGAGAEIGWGYQLQSATFVAVLALLFLAIGLNLVGVFEIHMPHISGPQIRTREAGALVTGLLAVLVASPCTVPFMAGAVGAAAVLPVGAALLIFAGLGIGMAAPFVIVGFVPAALRHLPRPGPWMTRLKQIMAFFMFASAAWLLWVLSAETGRSGLALALGAALLLGFALWALGERQRGAGLWSRWSGPASLGIAAVALVMVAGAPAPGTAPSADAAYTPYSAEQLAALRANGQPVFLEVTADWCITCKVNESLVLNTAPFALAMKAHNVAYLRADWTRRSGTVTRLLSAYGRNGVPLYVFFGPGAPNGEVLPQVLTLDAVLGILSTKADTLAAGEQVP